MFNYRYIIHKIMTRQDLEQLRSVKYEIRSLQEDLKNLPVVSDCVTGSRSEFPYTKRRVEIRGVDPEKSRKLRKKLEGKLESLSNQVQIMEEWLDSVEGSEIRTILRMYYYRGMTQQEIAQELGYSREAIGVKIHRFFKKRCG